MHAPYNTPERLCTIRPLLALLISSSVLPLTFFLEGTDCSLLPILNTYRCFWWLLFPQIFTELAPSHPTLASLFRRLRLKRQPLSFSFSAIYSFPCTHLSLRTHKQSKNTGVFVSTLSQLEDNLHEGRDSVRLGHLRVPIISNSACPAHCGTLLNCIGANKYAQPLHAAEMTEE